MIVTLVIDTEDERAVKSLHAMAEALVDQQMNDYADSEEDKAEPEDEMDHSGTSTPSCGHPGCLICAI